MNTEIKSSQGKIDHYLNAIKRSILQGTSRTSIDMSIKDQHTLIRLGSDVIPSETLGKIGKAELGQVNARYDEALLWMEETKTFIANLNSLPDEDKIVIFGELDMISEELLLGDITVKPHAILMSYLNDKITYRESFISDKGREFLLSQGGVNVDKLKLACQINPEQEGIMGISMDQVVIPFPITYLVFADITEVELIGNTDRAPATANKLRNKLSKNFEIMLAQNQLSPHQQMSLYRILGPERQQAKAPIEINNQNIDNSQQIVIVKNKEKLKPANLVVGENAELLGVGESYGNISKNNLLKFAAGELEESKGFDKVVTHRETKGINLEKLSLN